ncbi:MAG TPA: M56 family metallopeptidase [Bryobacteraceae bacterium]|nr:M56 family metallopeptidase [Bryobacteraceae bacterium]
MIDALIYSATSHFVQSTVFGGAAALLTLAFRANRAEVRFWLWLSASLKFLVPLAFLSMAGTHLRAWTPASSLEGIGATVPTFSFAPESFRHSSQDTAWGASSAGARSIDRPTLDQVIVGVWLSGVLCVALIRLRGWRRIRLLIRASVSTDIAAPIAVRASPALTEPGVVGWIRPLLLLPQGFAERLSPCEMKAILAHELCHVQRHDNLLVSIHMIVEAIFWFHPLVWWIGARLIEERECACDEDVVSRGNAPDLYAEALLKVCKWSTESPPACVAGVTGGNLKRRIEQIMDARDIPGLSFAKKAALAIAGAAVLTAPVLVGIANAPAILAQPPSEVAQWQAAAGGHMAFEVASVKLMKPGSRVWFAPGFPLDNGDSFMNPNTGESPHGRFAGAFPLPDLIEFAYKLVLTPDQARALWGHLPKWVETDKIEISARAAGNPTKDQMRLMMQSLLVERFHLAVHYETQEMAVYALTLIKPGRLGPKLIRHADGPPCDSSARSEPPGVDPDPDGAVFPPICYVQEGWKNRKGRIVVGSRDTTMALLAGSIAGKAGRPVVDRTGITDRIDYRLEWTPESNGPGPNGEEVQPDPHPLTFLDAVREQLGLKLEPTKAPVQSLVIDHIERPSEN